MGWLQSDLVFSPMSTFNSVSSNTLIHFKVIIHIYLKVSGLGKGKNKILST